VVAGSSKEPIQSTTPEWLEAKGKTEAKKRL
jgi:hypothetical protein